MGNIIHVALLEIFLGFSIFSIGKLFFVWELLFLMGYLLKGNYLTCQVRQTKTKSSDIYSSGNGLLFGIHGFLPNCIFSRCKTVTLALE